MKTTIHLILAFVACAAVGLAMGNVGKALGVPLEITFPLSFVIGFLIVRHLGPQAGDDR